MAEFIAVAGESDIAEGEMMPVYICDRRIVLAKIDGNFFAMGGICTHERANLDEGELLGNEIVCPLHFASFDIRTGKVLEPPAEEPEEVYEVLVRNGQVLVASEPTSSWG